jgi:hypothetical protein
LKVHALGFGDAARRIEDLERKEIPVVVEIENHARTSLVALRDLDPFLENDGQNVGSAIVSYLHGSFLQYFPILLDR